MLAGRKTVRYCGYAAIVTGCGAAVFDVTNHNVLSRSVMALATGVYVGYLYKTTEPNSVEELTELHRTAATAVLNTCLQNEGLYIKLGQGLSSMNHVMPPVMTEVFSVLLDKAPTVSFDEVRSIVTEELKLIQKKKGLKVGPGVVDNLFDDVFVSFEETPIASASIAQVHRAVIRDPNTQMNIPVAVKVQKPKIKTQIWWDLTCYYLLCYGIEKAFGIPLVFNARTINEEMSREVDFNIEAENANIMRECLQMVAPPGTPLKNVLNRKANQRPHIKIPEIYDHLLSERLMVSEWIEGAKLSEKKAVDAMLHSGGATRHDLIQGVLDTFADMVFSAGMLHVDPHGANLMLRPAKAPTASVDIGNNIPPVAIDHSHAISQKGFEVVLLDFGLCITESEKFKHSYALFFKAMYSADIGLIKEIVEGWGIGDGELFATLTLQKPFSAKRGMKKGESKDGASSAPLTPEEIREMETQLKERISTFLRNEEMVPRELIFVGRCLNILRSINKDYGSPVNRMNVFAERAIASLKQNGIQSMADIDDFVALKNELVAKRADDVNQRHAVEYPYHPNFHWKWSPSEQRELVQWSDARKILHKADTSLLKEFSDSARLSAVFLVFSALHVFHQVMQNVVVPTILFCVPSKFHPQVRKSLVAIGIDQSFEDLLERKEEDAIQRGIYGDDRRFVDEQKKAMRKNPHTMNIHEND